MSLFICIFLYCFVSISQVIGCEDRLRNDLYYVEWGVKLYSNQTISDFCLSNIVCVVYFSFIIIIIIIIIIIKQCLTCRVPGLVHDETL